MPDHLESEVPALVRSTARSRDRFSRCDAVDLRLYSRRQLSAEFRSISQVFGVDPGLRLSREPVKVDSLRVELLGKRHQPTYRLVCPLIIADEL